MEKYIVLSKKEILDYIRYILTNFKSKINDDTPFCHGTSYKNALSIIEHGGIYSYEEQVRRNIMTERDYNIFNDENHANGTRYVSLAGPRHSFGVKPDIYDPTLYDEAVFKVCSDEQSTIRTRHHENEYLIHSVPLSDIKGIDTRILRSCERFEHGHNIITEPPVRLDKLISDFNYLIDIANKLLISDSDIVICEASQNSHILMPTEDLCVAKKIKLFS